MFFGKPVGQHWERFSLVPEKHYWLLPSSAEPHCPPWPWQSHSLPSSQPVLGWEGRRWCPVSDRFLAPTCFLTHRLGLSCFVFISICSLTSPAIHKIFMQHEGSETWNLHASQQSGNTSVPVFLLSESIYCQWKRWDRNIYKIVSSLRGANIRPLHAHPVASPPYLRAVFLHS